MHLYFAPMEGISGYVHRNAHKAHFGQIEKYFAPFIVSDPTSGYGTKGFHDIMRENNPNITLIPQILSNNASDFLHTAQVIKQHGYHEINLNLGCPSRIVASKNRGSAFLALRDELDRFLDQIFSGAETHISIKTRTGKENHEEFYKLIDIFNQYPIKELIIHPRVQTDLYRNKPNLDMFRQGLTTLKMPVCYNGDIFTLKDYTEIQTAFPEVDVFMLGRGILTNPGLADLISRGKRIEMNTLISFHKDIYEGYREQLVEERKILGKMKETWFYMIQIFSNYHPYLYDLRRVTSLEAYEKVLARLFKEQRLLDDKVGYSS